MKINYEPNPVKTHLEAFHKPLNFNFRIWKKKRKGIFILYFLICLNKTNDNYYTMLWHDCLGRHLTKFKIAFSRGSSTQGKARVFSYFMEYVNDFFFKIKLKDGQKWQFWFSSFAMRFEWIDLLRTTFCF